MGIDLNSARFLLWGKQNGVDFSSSVTLGRQSVKNLSWPALAPMIHTLPMASSDENWRLALKADYVEPFLTCLGAQSITSIDASPYEQASVIHDMNLPYRGDQKFSFLLDGGTLEHVFDIATAFRNCMNLVTVGGHVLHILPANNFFGHGFYQFSAEFFYRLYAPENGFEVKKVLLVESFPGGRLYEVADPATVRRRVDFSNSLPINILVLAQRTSADTITRTPQQSDYEQLNWQGIAESRGRPSRMKEIVRNTLPGGLARVVLIAKHLLVREKDITPFHFTTENH